MLEAAENKNITFKTLGDGQLKFLGGTGYGLSRAALLSDGLSSRDVQQLAERLDRVEEAVNAGPGLTTRLRNMDENVQALMVRASVSKSNCATSITTLGSRHNW